MESMNIRRLNLEFHLRIISWRKREHRGNKGAFEAGFVDLPDQLSTEGLATEATLRSDCSFLFSEERAEVLRVAENPVPAKSP